MSESITLVLSGGNALGAYEAGAYETLHQRGFRPERVVGVSTGAINAALIAGNPPEQRVARLRSFWTAAAQDISTWTLGAGYWPMPWGGNRARALQASLLGSPVIYRPRFPGMLSLLPGAPLDISLFDLAPLRRRLSQTVDFARLNCGETRLIIVAADAHSGEEVRFDTAEGPIGLDHLLASCALLPFFPPVRIDDRLLVDGGMVANLPLEAALEDHTSGHRLCIALDLFRRSGGDVQSLGQALDRQIELMISLQTSKALKNLRQTHALRRQLQLLGSRLPPELRADPALAAPLAEGAKADGATTLLYLNHAGVPLDAELRAFDFSRPVLMERWAHGRKDMAEVLDPMSTRAAPGEFIIHAFSGGKPLPLGLGLG